MGFTLLRGELAFVQGKNSELYKQFNFYHSAIKRLRHLNVV